MVRSQNDAKPLVVVRVSEELNVELADGIVVGMRLHEGVDVVVDGPDEGDDKFLVVQ